MGRPKSKPSAPEVDLKTLHAKIGELPRRTLFRGCARQGRPSERKAMIDRGHKLSLIRQVAVLGNSRGSLYYRACPVPAAKLAIMRRIDELHLDYPFAGSRMCCAARVSRSGGTRSRR
jgi:putative transposase